MSMNLYIKVNGKNLDVIQTPTHITYMCLVDSKGRIKGQVGGKKALRAIHAYLLWADTRSDGVYKDAEELDEARKYVKEHRDYILNSIKKYKKLEVYVL